MRKFAKNVPWKKVATVVVLLVFALSAFFATSLLVSEDVEESIEDPIGDPREFEVYNECVDLADNAESVSDLRRAIRKCEGTEGILPDNSLVDAYSRWKRAEIQIAMALAAEPVDWEMLLSARALLYRALEILPPEHRHVRNLQVNIEILTFQAEEEAQKQLAEEGKSGEEIAEILSEALDPQEGDGFSEGDPGDDRY